MKVINKTIIELTMQELKQYALWALEAQGQISDNSEHEIVVVDESNAESNPGFILMKDKGQWVELDIDGWYFVPKNWNVWHCPNSALAQHTIIEVLFRNGSKETGPISDYKVSWAQENSPFDIIKYRVINKSLDLTDHLGY